MTSKELLRRIDERNYLTEREHREFLNILEKDLEILDKIRKTFKLKKEETINQNHYWLFIGKKIYMITRKQYDLYKEWLEENDM